MGGSIEYIRYMIWSNELFELLKSTKLYNTNETVNML